MNNNLLNNYYFFNYEKQLFINLNKSIKLKMTNSEDFKSFVDIDYDAGYFTSIIQSFILILTAELGDKTFIMLFILQLKTNKTTIFWSSLLAQILMNICGICVGYSIDFVLYKNYIDYLGICFYILYGYYLIGDSFTEKDESFAHELAVINDDNTQNIFKTQNIEEENKEEKLEEFDQPIVIKQPSLITKSILDRKLSVIMEADVSEEGTKTVSSPCKKSSKNKIENKNSGRLIDELSIEEENEDNDDNNNNNSELLIPKEEPEHENNNIDLAVFWHIFGSMAASEFGDRTQFIALSMSSIYNVSAILIGSCLALTCSCTLGVYFGKKLSSKLNVKVINFIVGCIFLIVGVEIYFAKRNYREYFFKIIRRK